MMGCPEKTPFCGALGDQTHAVGTPRRGSVWRVVWWLLGGLCLTAFAACDADKRVPALVEVPEWETDPDQIVDPACEQECSAVADASFASCTEDGGDGEACQVGAQEAFDVCVRDRCAEGDGAGASGGPDADAGPGDSPREDVGGPEEDAGGDPGEDLGDNPGEDAGGDPEEDAGDVPDVGEPDQGTEPEPEVCHSRCTQRALTMLDACLENGLGGEFCYANRASMEEACFARCDGNPGYEGPTSDDPVDPGTDDLSCDDTCEVLGSRLFFECVELTGDGEFCEVFAGDSIQGCLDSRCAYINPDPDSSLSCEESCETLAFDMYDRCRADGGSRGGCVRRAARMQEQCLEEQCTEPVAPEVSECQVACGETSDRLRRECLHVLREPEFCEPLAANAAAVCENRHCEEEDSPPLDCEAKCALRGSTVVGACFEGLLDAEDCGALGSEYVSACVSAECEPGPDQCLHECGERAVEARDLCLMDSSEDAERCDQSAAFSFRACVGRCEEPPSCEDVCAFRGEEEARACEGDSGCLLSVAFAHRSCMVDHCGELPPPECRVDCEREARESLEECVEGGRNLRACMEDFEDTVSVCAEDACRPPTCGESCVARANDFGRRCLERGRGREECMARRADALVECTLGECRPCASSCRERSVRVFEGCMSKDNAEEGRCREEALGMFAACAEESCDPPACEDQCHVLSEDHRRRCAEEGGDLAACEEGSEGAFEACFRDRCSVPEDPCVSGCFEGTQARWRSCLENGGDEEVCAINRDRNFADCFSGCRGETPCDAACDAAGARIFDRCMDEEGDEERCRAFVAEGHARCVAHTCGEPAHEPCEGDCGEVRRRAFEHCMDEDDSDPGRCEANASRAFEECAEMFCGPTACEEMCEVGARDAHGECMEEGNDPDFCEEVFHQNFGTCVLEECRRPSCEEECAAFSLETFEECVEAGVDEEECRREQSRAAAVCGELCEDPEPRCEDPCLDERDAHFDACMAEEGAEEELCRASSQEHFQVCVERRCGDPHACDAPCQEAYEEVFRACTEAGGGEEECRHEAEEAFGLCARDHCGEPPHECEEECVEASREAHEECMEEGGSPEACAMHQSMTMQACMARCDGEPGHCDEPCYEVKGRVFEECVDGGGDREFCMLEAEEAFLACVHDHCGEPPECDEPCYGFKEDVLEECLEEGGDEDFCNAEAEDAFVLCARDHCGGPGSCEDHCAHSGREAFEHCIGREGATEDECADFAERVTGHCQQRFCEPPACAHTCLEDAEEAFEVCGEDEECLEAVRQQVDVCIEISCPEPGPVTCEEECEALSGEFFDRCLSEGGTAVSCEAERHMVFEVCAEDCHVEPPPCDEPCHEVKDRVFASCMDAGGEEESCGFEADEAFRACAEDHCGGQTCEEPCHEVRSNTFEACMEEGGEETQCHDVADRAFAACAEAHCGPPCDLECGQFRDFAFDRCMHEEGSTEEACEDFAEEAYAFCREDSCTPCDAGCDQVASEARRACEERQGADADCLSAEREAYGECAEAQCTQGPCEEECSVFVERMAQHCSEEGDAGSCDFVRSAAQGICQESCQTPDPTCQERCFQQADTHRMECLDRGEAPEECDRLFEEAFLACAEACSPGGPGLCEEGCFESGQAAQGECLDRGHREEFCTAVRLEVEGECAMQCHDPHHPPCVDRCVEEAAAAREACPAGEDCSEDIFDGFVGCVASCRPDGPPPCEDVCARVQIAVFDECMGEAQADEEACYELADGAFGACMEESGCGHTGSCNDHCHAMAEHAEEACEASDEDTRECALVGVRAFNQCSLNSCAPGLCEEACGAAYDRAFSACAADNPNAESLEVCEVEASAVFERCFQGLCSEEDPQPPVSCSEKCARDAEEEFVECQETSDDPEACQAVLDRAFGACFSTCMEPEIPCNAGCQDGASAVFFDCMEETEDEAHCRELAHGHFVACTADACIPPCEEEDCFPPCDDPWGCEPPCEGGECPPFCGEVCYEAFEARIAECETSEDTGECLREAELDLQACEESCYQPPVDTCQSECDDMKALEEGECQFSEDFEACMEGVEARHRACKEDCPPACDSATGECPSPCDDPEGCEPPCDDPNGCEPSCGEVCLMEHTAFVRLCETAEDPALCQEESLERLRSCEASCEQPPVDTCQSECDDMRALGEEECSFSEDFEACVEEVYARYDACTEGCSPVCDDPEGCEPPCDDPEGCEPSCGEVCLMEHTASVRLCDTAEDPELCQEESLERLRSCEASCDPPFADMCQSICSEMMVSEEEECFFLFDGNACMEEVYARDDACTEGCSPVCESATGECPPPCEGYECSPSCGEACLMEHTASVRLCETDEDPRFCMEESRERLKSCEESCFEPPVDTCQSECDETMASEEEECFFSEEFHVCIEEVYARHDACTEDCSSVCDGATGECPPHCDDPAGCDP